VASGTPTATAQPVRALRRAVVSRIRPSGQCCSLTRVETACGALVADLSAGFGTGRPAESRTTIEASASGEACWRRRA
jgi:hypothetical protein